MEKYREISLPCPYLYHAPAAGGRGLAGTEQWAGVKPSGPFGLPAERMRSRTEEGDLQSGHTSSIAHPPPQERGADRKPPKGNNDRDDGNEKQWRWKRWCEHSLCVYSAWSDCVIFMWTAGSIHAASPCLFPDNSQCLGIARPGPSVHVAASELQRWRDYWNTHCLASSAKGPSLSERQKLTRNTWWPKHN